MNVFYGQRKDLLQLMIEASDSETQEGLEKGNIVADSVGFILAGYDTTSTALTFATYALAANPEVQEKLADEIRDYFENNPVSSLQYIAEYCSSLCTGTKDLSFRTGPCTMPHTSSSTLRW